MTRENKFKIGLALQGIALSMDDATLERNRDRLKQIEDIIIAEPTEDEKTFDIETYCKEHFCVMVDKDVWEKAEKALKQENILDKIRAEIVEMDLEGRVDAHTLFIRTPEQVKQMALNIIDKYKAESEG